MIINASGRTDIPAFYSKWFINRLKAGFLDVRNPFYPKQVSRIMLDSENIEAIIFCTKNPIPMMKYLEELSNYKILFHITITPYEKDIEPNVVSKKILIDKVKELSKDIGKDRIFLRYDPILINSKYTIDYHVRAFEKLLNLLDGSIAKVIISFVDMKKNTIRNMSSMKLEELTLDKVNLIAKQLAEIASKHGVIIQTCAEHYDLSKYGFLIDSCNSASTINKLTDSTKKYHKNKNREFCNCVETVDIGAYNCCNHLCRYCYANYDENNVLTNISNHDDNSSLIIGQLDPEDVIKLRN